MTGLGYALKDRVKRIKEGIPPTVTDARTRRILVTRPQPAADDFAEKLRNEGFEVFVAPMTEYVELNTTIGDLATYQGLVFTSAQAVNILARHFTERYIPVFAVGDSTAQTAEKAGFRRVYSAQGDAGALLALIRSRQEHHGLKRLLHPCGEDTSEDFAEQLKADGIYVDRVPVYKAEYVNHLPPAILRALQEGDITTVTLFSARTAGNFAHMLETETELKGLSADLEAVCLSDRVAAEVNELPWRAVRVANAPQLENVMDILRQKEEGRQGFTAMPADPVIEAFGGLRPLANTLDITASTVQGWKKRGVIPESRVEAVVRAANQAGIATDRLWKAEGKNTMTDASDGKPATNKTEAKPTASAAPKTAADRRGGPDRREKYTAPDKRGNISHDKYEGPDRRAGVDRRSYQERQAGRIAAEKWRFLNRSVVMGAFFTIAGLYAISLTLQPELNEMSQKSGNVEAMQAQVDDLNKRIIDLQRQQQGEILGLENKMEQKQASFGQSIYNRLGEIEATKAKAAAATEQVTSVAGAAAGAVGDAAIAAANTTQIGRDLTAFLQVLGNLSHVGKAKGGQDSITRSFARIREILAVAPTDSAGLNAAVQKAMKGDKDLQLLLGNIEVRDLGAAALLLALNEFRGNINTNRSFEQDLLIMQKYLGDDPKMKAALKRLTPYAKGGVLNRKQLQNEFSGLASDIVMAKLQGQDLSVKQEMLKRLSKLVKVRKIDDIEGTSVDATVARAQLKLNEGDVKGAMRELQTLEGEPAKTAAPFMEAAAGNVMAGDATEQLLQNIIQQFQPEGGAAEGANLGQIFDDIWNKGPEGLMPYISGGARDTSVTSPYVGPPVFSTPSFGQGDSMGPMVVPEGGGDGE